MSVDPATGRGPGAPTIPRAEWSAHPRFPEQALLLGSHENFRRISRHLIHVVKDGDPLPPVAHLHRMWIGAMRSHEAYEEHKLYRFLEHRWAVSMRALSQGHDELHTLHDAVVAAFRAARDADSSEARHDVAAALEAHDESLRRHLELEEDTVIPLLLELEPDEFARFTHLPIEALV